MPLSAAGVQVPDKLAKAGATEVASIRLLELGADEKAVARANELDQGALFALHMLHELAASWEGDGPSRSRQYWGSQECRREIVRHLRTVERIRTREQANGVRTYGQAREAVTHFVGRGDKTTEAVTGCTRTNGPRPAAIVSELAQMLRDKHPAAYRTWWSWWRGDIRAAKSR